MRPLELLAELRWKGVHLSVCDGALRVEAPPDALDDALRARLRASEPALLELLRATSPELVLLAQLGRGARERSTSTRGCGCTRVRTSTPRQERKRR